MEPDAYVHRIGRTDRADYASKSMAFFTEEKISLLKDIEKLVRKKLMIEDCNGFHAGSITILHRNGQTNAKPKTKRNR